MEVAMKKRKERKNGLGIASAIGAIVLIGILVNGRDLLRYIKISSM
jgi:hypothetical protein